MALMLGHPDSIMFSSRAGVRGQLSSWNATASDACTTAAPSGAQLCSERSATRTPHHLTSSSSPSLGRRYPGSLCRPLSPVGVTSC
eukprot:3562945-Pyramimonas_sp.AAC.2